MRLGFVVSAKLWLVDHLHRLAEEKRPIVVMVSGKDSMATWQALREAGANIVAAVHLYLVPGMSFIERHLARVESCFGMPVERWPHPQLNRMLRKGLFQPPERYHAYRGLARWTMLDMDRALRRRWPGAWQALGNRIADNLNRRVAEKNHGSSWNPKRGVVWPIYGWSNALVVDAIRRSGLPLPVDYRMFGRSFDGLNYQYIAPIKRYFPDDYAKLLEWFPLADCEFTRRARQEKHHAHEN